MSTLFLLPFLSAMLTLPDTILWQQQFAQCVAETDPHIRLACYDALERHRQVNPAKKQTAITASSADTPDAIDPDTTAGNTTSDDDRFQLHTDSFTGDLILTRAIKPQGRLTIACIKNITWLRVELVQPWRGNEVITSTDDLRTVNDWFIRNNGMTLEYGRGLPAIATLKSWFVQHHLELNNSYGQSLHLDLSGLADAIKPLRQQCHWWGE